jgi:hypothetical protein
MARYHEDGIQPASYEADVDLSAACALYRFARAASGQNKVNLANGASNPAVLGVMQNCASQGHPVAVKTHGHTLVVGRAAACNLTHGRFIVSGSDGVAEAPATTNGSPVCGRWLGPTITSGSAIGEALLFGYTACHMAHS